MHQVSKRIQWSIPEWYFFPMDMKTVSGTWKTNQSSLHPSPIFFLTTIAAISHVFSLDSKNRVSFPKPWLIPPKSTVWLYIYILPKTSYYHKFVHPEPSYPKIYSTRKYFSQKCPPVKIDFLKKNVPIRTDSTKTFFHSVPLQNLPKISFSKTYSSKNYSNFDQNNASHKFLQLVQISSNQAR